MVNSAASSPLHAEAPALSILSRLATPEITIVKHWAPECLRNNDPGIDHRLRVAVHKLRALLWVCRDLPPKALTDDWRCRLADVAARVGPPGNWDIIVNVLLRAAVPPSQPSTLILPEALEGIRQHARTKSRIAFEGIGSERLMADFSGATGKTTQAQPETSETLGKFAHASIATVSRRMDRAFRHTSSGGLQELHQMRIQIKRLRYLLEFFSSMLGGRDIERIRRLKQLQDALGELNNVIVGAAYIFQVPARPGYTTTHELFVQWLRKGKKTRRRAAIAALGCLPCKR